MTAILEYPVIRENMRTVAISSEAAQVRQSAECSHRIFLGDSIFTNQIYDTYLKKKFDIYSGNWKNETVFASSVSEIVGNHAYRAIINLGPDVIPFILEDLRSTHSFWFHALEILTGHNPIKPEHRGDIMQMTNDWITWAKENNWLE